MSSRTVTVTGGPGLLGCLTLLFIGLKLGHVVAWSWWWVLAPFWIPLALVVVLFALAFVGFYATARAQR